jgi:mannose-6-phosphate isomerase
MFALVGHRRSYDWGSTDALHRFLGREPDGSRIAEIWFGAHPSGSSLASTSAGDIPLTKVIASDPDGALGAARSRFASRLPFLVKLLAPARPLSLQAHPTPRQALAGYEREMRRAAPAAERVFLDPFHKPEMVFALTAFEGLVGWRPRAETIRSLRALGLYDIADSMVVASTDELANRSAFDQLLGLDSADLARILARAGDLADADQALSTATELAAHHPGDLGCAIALLLQRIRLNPGEAVFVADGVPHAYLRGIALEVMANSDNVFRLGLTQKPVHLDLLREALDFGASALVLGAGASDDLGSREVKPPASEFALTCHRLDGAMTTTATGPRIVVCIGGSVRVREGAGDVLHLNRGDAAFVAASDAALTLEGTGEVIEVHVPGERLAGVPC